MTIALPPILNFEEFEAETVALLAPPPYKPRFRALTWSQLGQGSVKHEWLIKNLLTKGEKSFMAGASQTGKSFEATALGLAVARGVPYHGRRVAHCGVIYVAAESSQGVIARRLPAYRQAFDLKWEDDLPFVTVTQAPNLYAGDEDTDALIQDILHYATGFRVPLGLVILDTYSALTPGAKEIASEDVGAIMGRIDRIREKTGAHVLTVHHMNADATKMRGHTSLKANVDTVLEVSWDTISDGKTKATRKDADNRDIRKIVIDKQKDGASGHLCNFVLKQIKLGQDEDGDPITSCVTAEPAGQQESMAVEAEQRGRGITADGRLILQKGESVLFGALRDAIQKHGRRPPSHIDAPKDAECVTLTNWRDVFAPLLAGENEDEAKLAERAKKARDRGIERFLALKLIDKRGDWVWRTNRRTHLDPPTEGRRRRQVEEAPSTVVDDDDDNIPF